MLTNPALRVLVAIQNTFARMRDEETGATATEYALLLGFIAVVVVVAVAALGTKITSLFTKTTTSLGS